MALVASLFGPWYVSEEKAYFNRSVGGDGYTVVRFDWSGWVAFSVIDLVLVAIAALALGAVWSATRERRDAAQVLIVTAGAGAVGIALVVWRLIDSPFDAGPGAGAWVGLAGLAAIVAGGVLGARGRAF